MHYSEIEIEELKQNLCSNIREIEEGGHVYVYIPGLKMPPGCLPEQTDALLCPTEHGGYTSRLFLKDQIKTPKEVNWNGQVFVLGHQWHAFSYNNVTNMTLLQMVMNHLRGMTV